MGWSTNEKATAKRNLEQAKKKQKQNEKLAKQEEMKWKDEKTQKKLNEARQKEEKRMIDIQEKRQLKKMLQQQEDALSKEVKKKALFETKKLTLAEIESRKEGAYKQAQKEIRLFPQQNPNLNQDEVAESVDQALQFLQDKQQKHPEKRFKAAFQAFCQKRQFEVKIEYPKMKRSQRLQLMRKQFDKHPDNPFNKATLAYNEKKH